MRQAIVVAAILALTSTFEIDRVAVTPLEAAQQVADIVAKVRQALGGDRLDTVQAFSAEGSYRRLLGPRELDGTLEIIATVDGRMRRLEELSMGGMTNGPSIERIVTLNGDRAWEESNQRGGMGGGMMMLRMGPGPGGA
ncbi:MAG: hypothetical protein AB1635_21250, partial [Acidobacteriota bacterium]